MSTICGTLIAAVTLLGLLVLFQIERKKSRRRRLEGLELRPNCLLTRDPIAFIAGPKSVFRLFDHWNEIPAYLREHGYEVLLLETDGIAGGTSADAGRAKVTAEARAAAIVAALDDLKGRCHIVGDTSARGLIERLAQAKHPHVSSLTVVQHTRGRRNTEARTTAEDLRPRPNAVETFEIPTTALQSGYSEMIALMLLRLHNFFVFGLVRGHGRRVDVFETAELNSRDAWAIEERFLDLAVTLAERDAHGV